MVLEALLQGTPCIVSDTVGAKDLIPLEARCKNDEEIIGRIEKLREIGELATIRSRVRDLDLDYKLAQHVRNIKNLFYEN